MGLPAGFLLLLSVPAGWARFFLALRPSFRPLPSGHFFGYLQNLVEIQFQPDLRIVQILVAINQTVAVQQTILLRGEVTRTYPAE